MTTSPNSWQDLALALVLIVLGSSFAYKFFLASIMGRVSYWTGFLPFTLISPFFIHLPASKRSLIREAQGLWVYMFMGPIFLILSILLIAAGVDLAGFPGTDTINYIINHGDRLRTPAITFDKRGHTFSFPLFVRSAKNAAEKFNKWKVPMAEKDKMLKDDSYSSK